LQLKNQVYMVWHGNQEEGGNMVFVFQGKECRAKNLKNLWSVENGPLFEGARGYEVEIARQRGSSFPQSLMTGSVGGPVE